VQTLVQTYGLPMSYYVDSLRVFRFVQGRDSVWRKQVLGTDQADPQWRQVMRIRLWWEGKLVHTLACPLQQFRVHF
jgi:hypothetical protein